MSRAVTGDHIMFEECIEVFRREYDTRVFTHGESYAYLVTSFAITETWDLSVCKLEPSIRVALPGPYAAFISRLKHPKWVGIFDGHLFSTALAAIITSVTLKPCKSPRDYSFFSADLTPTELRQLAILNPTLIAGAGATQSSLSQVKLTQMRNDIFSLINKLNTIKYNEYKISMQSIRLLHLSLCSTREDFGLGYLLAISAIESVALKAIKRDKVKPIVKDEILWEEESKNNPSFKNLLDAYRDARGKNEYLKERFVTFILKYAPANKWLDYIEHPMQDFVDYFHEINQNVRFDHIIQKQASEKYPNDFSGLEIRDFLADAYTHRSHFVHRGQQPPHKESNLVNTRFFQQYYQYKDESLKTIILPNYSLLVGIAKNSIINWINDK